MRDADPVSPAPAAAQRRPLSRRRVVCAAAELADRAGADALILAAVARELDASVPAVLKHVRNSADLRAAVGTLAVDDMADCVARATVGVAGRDAVVRAADAYRTYAAGHPGRYHLGFGASHWHDEAFVEAGERLVGIVEDILVGYDLDVDRRVDAVRMLRASLHGFASIEAAGGLGRRRSTDASYRVLVSMLHTSFVMLGTDG